MLSSIRARSIHDVHIERARLATLTAESMKSETPDGLNGIMQQSQQGFNASIVREVIHEIRAASAHAPIRMGRSLD
jgi:hypothetical protein